MEKFLRYLIFYGLIAAILTVGTLFTLNRVEVVAEVGGAAQPQKQIQDSVEGWQYKYVIAPQSDGSYLVTRDYDFSAVEIKSATTALNQQAAKLAATGKAYKVILVFAKPLSIADFESFVKTTGIAPSLTYIQATTPDNTLVEASIPSVKASNEPIDTKFVTALEKDPKHPLKLVGVTIDHQKINQTA